LIQRGIVVGDIIRIRHGHHSPFRATI